MQLGDLLCARRKELGLNQAELAARMTALGHPVSNQAVSKWENGSTLPNARQFLALCDLLEIDDIRGYFTGGGEGLLRGLDAAGRAKALDYIQLLRWSGRYALHKESEKIVPLRSLPLYSLAVSAGTGQFLDGEDYEMVEVGAEVPEGANFGVRVAGDSMEPRFHNGQTVWVRQQRSRQRLSQAAGGKAGPAGPPLPESRLRRHPHLAGASPAGTGQSGGIKKTCEGGTS